MTEEDKPVTEKRLLFPLRFAILFIFVTLFLLTVAIITTIRSLTFYQELTDTALNNMRYVSNVVLDKLADSIRPIQVDGLFSAQLIQSGVVKDDAMHLVPYTYYLAKMIPLVRGAYYGDKDGNFIYARKEDNGSITTEVFNRTVTPMTHSIMYRDLAGAMTSTIQSNDLSYDPRVRPWYIEASNAKAAIWTNIYLFYPNLFLGISTGIPVFDTLHNVQGVFGFDVSLNYITQFLKQLTVTTHGYAFIITRGEDLIAYPQVYPFSKMVVKPNTLINVHRIGLPLIDRSIDYYKKNNVSTFSMRFHGQWYLISYQSVPDFISHGWLVGVISPQSDFISVLQKMNWDTLWVSFLILMISVLIVLKLVTRIVQPINVLTHHIQKIKRFELDDQFTIDSHVKEIVVLNDAIHAMQTGLKQFQRYVPKVLVRQLIESGQDIKAGGTRIPLAVLFSDVDNFTAISEHVDPNALSIQMCEYFEALTRIIINEKGTIDKYMGDSVMAFWGAPLEVADPSLHAANTALLCLDKINALNIIWAQQGKPKLETRFGIHFGDAIVGNIGSLERLNYTAVGDTINITSRLQAINKIYHTKIIVSGAVYEQIKDHFVLRLLDKVTVKGRSEPIAIYELVAKKIE